MPDKDKNEFEEVKDILDKELTRSSWFSQKRSPRYISSASAREFSGVWFTDDDAVTQFIKKAISLNDRSELLKYIDQNKQD